MELIGTATDGKTRSRLSSQARATGDGGNITVETGRLSIRDGANISADTFTQNAGGTLTVRASEVELIGTTRDGSNPSGLFTTVQKGATGAGGNIIVETGRLIAQNGAQISTATWGEGAAGTLAVRARESVELSGTNLTDSQYGSGIFTSVQEGARGAGGNLTLETKRLILRDGAVVSTATLGQGPAGNLEVRASESVELMGTSADGKLASLLSARSTETADTARAGNVTISTGRLIVRDGARVTTSTASGKGGNIDLQVRDYILMRHQGLISAEAKNDGDGGNITINPPFAPFIVALPRENSDILANAYLGRGGNITINTSGIYGLENRPQLTPFSDINASSQYGVNGTVQINTPEVDPSRGLTNLPSNVIDASNQIAQNCAAGGGKVAQNEFIITGRGGLPPSPDDALSTDAVWTDLRTPTAAIAIQGEEPVTRQVSTPQPRLVEANGWVMNDKGEVVLIATASTVTSHSLSLTPSQCHVPQTSREQPPDFRF